MKKRPLISNETPNFEHTAFQLERISLFTDAVFAIALTLLVIEIKVPELTGPDHYASALTALYLLIPKFIGLLVAFFVIIIFWIAHHRLFRYVKQYDNNLLWLNALFLLSIVIMPFTSGFFSSYFLEDIPFIVYCLSVTATGLMILLLQHYCKTHSPRLISHENARHPDLDTVRLFLAPGVFLTAIIIDEFWTWGGRLAIFIIVPVLLIYRYRYHRLQKIFNQHPRQAH